MIKSAQKYQLENFERNYWMSREEKRLKQKPVLQGKKLLREINKTSNRKWCKATFVCIVGNYVVFLTSEQSQQDMWLYMVLLCWKLDFYTKCSPAYRKLNYYGERYNFYFSFLFMPEYTKCPQSSFLHLNKLC